jgi:hypothetical protein
MAAGDPQLKADLRRALRAFGHVHPLPGVADVQAESTLIRQFVDSVHRGEYIRRIAQRPASQDRANPGSKAFDPYKAALLKYRAGDIDEAIWLVFLSVQFGKHKTARWATLRAVYGRLGQGGKWDWSTIARDQDAFRKWLNLYQSDIPSRFGNHRKYASLKPDSKNQTADAFETYVAWVGSNGGHAALFRNARARSATPEVAFDALYRGMRAVASFGRMARFDYLTMVGKLGFADIIPGSAYLEGATGPKSGAELLFGKQRFRSLADVDVVLIELGRALGVDMQVIEDALCNWQKSPREYKRFTG